ncbi:MAG TPA: YbaY family lipoprotein [Candidatus Binatia bacterium]|nr:YbaY family lipoprotein [Candidatus Binatia bacterium]
MTALSSFTLVTLLGLVLVGCVAPGAEMARTSENGGMLRGSVAYRERVALPTDAVVEVRLFDVSVQDIAAPVVAETAIAAGGRQVPIPFELKYDPSKIRKDRTYAVRATIHSAGRMIFTTDSGHRVITQGNPTRVDLWLVRVSGPKR